jgi:hypothetical protein
MVVAADQTERRAGQAIFLQILGYGITLYSTGY